MEAIQGESQGEGQGELRDVSSPKAGRYLSLEKTVSGSQSLLTLQNNELVVDRGVKSGAWGSPERLDINYDKFIVFLTGRDVLVDYVPRPAQELDLWILSRW